jgi:hypothetical protein
MLAYFRKKQAEMRGLDIELTLNLPGRILDKSGNLRAGKTPNQVIARITAAEIRGPADLLRLLAPYYFIEFDSRECSFGPNPGRRAMRRPAPPGRDPAPAERNPAPPGRDSAPPGRDSAPPSRDSAPLISK